MMDSKNPDDDLGLKLDDSSGVGSPSLTPGAGDVSQSLDPLDLAPVTTPDSDLVFGTPPSSPIKDMKKHDQNKDDATAPIPSKDNENVCGLSQTPLQGHQDSHDIGEIKLGFKVLLCTNMSISIDYEQVYLLMKAYGKIVKIRLALDISKTSFNCYIVFDKELSAKKAKEYFHNHLVNDCILKTRVFHIDNLKDDPFDFSPQEIEGSDIIERKLSSPRWFVASYKKGKENLVKGIDFIKRKIGSIPEGNIKRYGKAILIKAGNESQSYLLNQFKASEHSNIDSISPHKSFNTAKGIIFSKELYEFSEADLLRKCPDNVWSVNKLKGNNQAILITFTSSFLPDYLKISHINFEVKKFNPKPTQCRKCYDYGHVVKYCENEARCFNCSSIHDLSSKCTNDTFCIHCQGAHPPNWRGCPIYKYHLDTVVMAENEHISIGAARRKVRKISNAPMQTFSSVLKTARNSSNTFVNKETPNDNTDKETRTLVDSAEIHNPSAGGSKTNPSPNPSEIPREDPNSSANAEKEKSRSVKPKTNIRPTNGFWTPPRNKKAKPSSPPPSFKLETSNPFNALDPCGPLLLPHPLKKMAHAQSCSELDRMDTSNPNKLPDETVQVKPCDKPVAISDKEYSSKFDSEKRTSGSHEISKNLDLLKEKRENKKKTSLPSTNQKNENQGSKIKRLQYHFKSFSRPSSETQPKGSLAGSKKKMY